MNATAPLALASDAVALAGHNVGRVGFGAARLTAGDGWGAPADADASRRLLLEAVDAGLTYVDTADALGPTVSETLIGETLGNRSDVLVATKVGMLRPDEHRWAILGHPDYLRQQVHASRYRLKRERIDLLYLHRIDPDYPLADQWGALQELRDEGIIGHLGVSQPDADQLAEILRLDPALAAVQSLHNIVAPADPKVLAQLAPQRIPFVAYWPLVGRGLPRDIWGRLAHDLTPLARERNLTLSQLLLAWIFSTVEDSIAIAGSRSASHLRENAAAAAVRLDADTLRVIADRVPVALDGASFDPRASRDSA